jgi:hypothetical protein
MEVGDNIKTRQWKVCTQVKVGTGEAKLRRGKRMCTRGRHGLVKTGLTPSGPSAAVTKQPTMRNSTEEPSPHYTVAKAWNLLYILLCYFY